MIDCVPLNPVLLRAALTFASSNAGFSFANIGEAVEARLAALRSAAVLGWENKSFNLFGEKIELPMLDLDYAEIAAFRDTVK